MKDIFEVYSYSLITCILLDFFVLFSDLFLLLLEGHFILSLFGPYQLFFWVEVGSKFFCEVYSYRLITFALEDFTVFCLFFFFSIWKILINLMKFFTLIEFITMIRVKQLIQFMTLIELFTLWKSLFLMQLIIIIKLNPLIKFITLMGYILFILIIYDIYLNEIHYLD